MRNALSLLTAAWMASAGTAQAADEWGIEHERKARFEAKVVDILCELTGDCPANCGDGKRQLGLLKDDGTLIPAVKNFDALAGTVNDLQPSCGQRIMADGLLIDDPVMKVFTVRPTRSRSGSDGGPRGGPHRGPPHRGTARRPAEAPAKGLWLYGRHAVEAALANPRRSCHRLLATAEAHPRLGAYAKRQGLDVRIVERAEIDRQLGPDAVHQGLALSVAPLPGLGLEDACAREPGRNLVLMLDQITDPHNLGAILRSAAAFGVRAVVMAERRTAPLGGTVAKAASGALDLVPVVEVVNLARALDQLAEMGYWRIALDGHAEASIAAAPEVDDLVLVLGAEGEGVRRLVREHCDLAVRLPIAPSMESLNVSVACGIALYALAIRAG